MDYCNAIVTWTDGVQNIAGSYRHTAVFGVKLSTQWPSDHVTPVLCKQLSLVMNMPARHFQTRCRPVEMRPWRCSGRWRYMHPTMESERGRPQLWSALTGCIYLPPVQTSTRVCAASPMWQLAVSHWAFKQIKNDSLRVKSITSGKKMPLYF